ncbi:VOC family protein [Clostridium baratii]|uniref:VOC family protein n=2 Tax=Clostridiaceae TaxID=31979 RepID=A0ABP3X4A8_9CLOT
MREFMNFKNIHHVAIISSNYEKSKNFYTKILGLEIIREVYREDRDSYKLDLKIGNSQIELFSFRNPPKRLSYPEACGLRHLALEVNNIEEVINELNLNGIDTEEVRIDEFTNCKFTFFEDPDGLPIELYETK